MSLCVTKSAVVIKDNFFPFLVPMRCVLLFRILNITYAYSVLFSWSTTWNQAFIVCCLNSCKSIQWATSLLPECSSKTQILLFLYKIL